jgi:pimeloyl-ACP methyl ester carboxylesterase
MKQAALIPDWAFKPGMLIDVGGHRMNMYCMGQGSPTVVLSAGGGWGAIAFSGIQPRIAETTRVCAYDRAGRGFSDNGPLHPAIGAEVTDLHTALHKAGVDGPFVLVGWSVGGMEVRRYAWSYPKEVVGIVTIDGSVFDIQPATDVQDWLPKAIRQYEDCERAAESGAFDKDAHLLRTCASQIDPLDFLPKSRAAMAERVRSPESYAVILQGLRDRKPEDDSLCAMRRPFGAIPFVALVAGDHFIDSADAKGVPEGTVSHQVYLRAAYDLASLSSDGLVIGVPYSTHSIHFDRPDVVVHWIDGVVDEVRANPHPPTAAP